MKRREFIQTSALLGAGALAAGSISSCSNSSEKVEQTFSADVLVIGGGPAGVCAALAAARHGSKVLLVESGGCLGGMATQGLVSPFMTCYDRYGEQMVIKGLFSEIVDKMVDLGGAIHPSQVRATSPYSAWITDGHDHLTPFDSECLKYVLDTLVQEAGVKVLLHTHFLRPLMSGSSIRGAMVFTKKGLTRIDAPVTIDCTGDGDVCFRAGCECTFGNPQSGKVQPSTLFFHINNVNSAELEADVQAHLHEFRKVDGVSYRALHWRVQEAEANGEWDINRKSVNIYKGVRDDEWAVNSTRIGSVDSTDSESLTKGEFEGRRQVQMLMNFFHKYVPGCKDATLKSSASTLGIRESRHVKGEHVLEASELINGVVPEDSVLVAANSVDVHGGGATASSTTYTMINAPWYGIPYRCLVPLGVEGLLMAGRCLSASSDAAGAVRVMPPVMAMGQAAGLAAAMCAKAGCKPRNLDPSDLRKHLLEQKVFLG